MHNALQAIVKAGGITKPDGTLFPVPLRRLALEAGAISHVLPWIAAEGYKNPRLIADENTAAFLPVENAIILPAGVKPEKRVAEEIIRKTQGADVLVALGSGTIGDLVKYASYNTSKPYAMVATAPSMNGYLSATASLLGGAEKHSEPAHLPAALFADLDILAAAPLRLIQSGFGDSICRSTAQFDWLFSHLKFGTPYDPLPFQLQADAERRTLASLPGLLTREQGAIRALTEWLLMAGLGMSYFGGSHPASQGEHAIAHAMELLYPELTAPYYHGEHIAVTTVAMAHIQEDLLATQAFAPYRAELAAIHIPPAQIEKWLKSLKIKTIPSELDWPEAAFHEALQKAPHLRPRPNVLSALTKF